MKHRLMNAAGGFGDAGGTGDAPPQDAPPAQTAEYAGPAWAKDWEGIAELDAETLGDPSLKVFTSPTALVKSYVHAQKQLGKKGVMVPTENSPKEEWDQFYAKVGVPLEETKYKESLKFPEKNELGDDFNTGFLKLAHEARVQPTQAAKLYEYFNTQVKSGAEKHAAEQADKAQAALNALSEEYGAEAYGVKLTKATNFLKEHAGEEFIKYLGESGLGKNAMLVKSFMAMADKISKEPNLPNGDSTFGMTKDDAQREINLAMSNFDDPYHKAGHSDHKRRVDEIQKLFQKLDK